MTHNIKFSVTVPAYKAQFLAECIDSILVQTYKNFELIIVNDASPKDLDSIVSKYDDPRIRYYKNKVGFGAEHVVGNWNKCLEYATGDYIICMGDDDKLLPNCLEEYVKLIEKYPGLGLYHGWTEQIDENSNIIGLTLPAPERESCYTLIFAKLVARREYIGDYLFEVSLLRSNGGFYDLPFAWGSDDMSAYIAAMKNGVAHTRIPVFQYRISHYSISSSKHNRGKMESMAFQLKWVEKLLTSDKASQIPADQIVRNVLLKIMPSIWTKTIKDLMLLDLKADGRLSGLCYWINKRDTYKYKLKLVLRVFLKSLG